MLKTSAFTLVLLVVASSLMASGPTSSPAAVQERCNAWEISVAKGNHADATKLRVLMQGMSFGDGTGYFANTLYPPPKPPGSF